jgi:hypothetical protein
MDPQVATASLRIWAAGGDESPAPRTTVRVWFTGGDAVAGRTFYAHLHADPCESYTGAHYKNDPSGPVDAVNENWPIVNCDANSTCIGYATTLWEPTVAAIDSGLSVVIHNTPPPRPGVPQTTGDPYLCADLIGPPPIPVNNSLAELETRQICKTVIRVEYSTPIRLVLGDIVLGIGENGAVISLFPGTFTATAEMFLCDGLGRLLPVGEPPRVAFRGETIVDFTASTSGQRRSIVIYAIDTRTPDELSPYEQNFAPIITSIEITPQTVAIGQTATITASGYEVNGGDFIRSMALDIFEKTSYTRHVHNDIEVYQRNRIRDEKFDFTPRELDFAGSAFSTHDLVGRVTATDDFNLTGSAEIPFTVNRLEMVEIGAVAFTRPTVALDPRKQNHSTAYGGSPAVVKLDVFDRDFIYPPRLRPGVLGLYQEKLTYRIEIFGNATIPGRNGNTVENPACQPADTSGRQCDYVECTCTEEEDSDGNVGCEEIVVSRIANTTEGGEEWTFEWDPWVNQSSPTMPAGYGTTYCQLMVYFVDNTGSVNISDSFLNATTSISIEGLNTSTVSVLLEADPDYQRPFNRPPSVRYFWGAHLDLDLTKPPVTKTTVTVVFQDEDGRPNTTLGYLAQTGGQCADPSRSTRTPQACFRAFTPIDDDVGVVRTDRGLTGVEFQDVWTFNGARVLNDTSPGRDVDVYIQMEDAVSEHVGYHHVAFLRRATSRRRRDAAAAGPQVQAMTLTIDPDGKLSGSMVFPDAWVSDDGDGDGGTGVIQVPGGASTPTSGAATPTTATTPATTPATTQAHDGVVADDDDGSTDRQLMLILVLVCSVGCLCVLGAAICLAYRYKTLVVALDKNGDNKGHATEFAEAADGSDSGAVRFVGTQSSSC